MPVTSHIKYVDVPLTKRQMQMRTVAKGLALSTPREFGTAQSIAAKAEIDGSFSFASALNVPKVMNPFATAGRGISGCSG